MIKAGIVGGAGYTGGEMIRILINHPEVELASVVSASNSGNKIYNVHTDLLGDTDMAFAESLADNLDVVFLCMGHGDSRKYLETANINPKTKIIDLSQDFRLESTSSIGERKFVYGLCEVNHKEIEKASNIANPGCFATAIQLAIAPLAASKKLNSDIHVTAVTGSTGAGQSLSQTSHFSWRANNLSTYKTFDHQHLNEIGETVGSLEPNYTGTINFIPYRGDFTRGIMASVYTESDLSAEEAVALYKNYYKDSRFVFVSDKNIHLKQVVNTNKCLLYVSKHENKILIMSAIDNLIKGASGQAVQNMNIIFGLDERAGLNLKPVAF